MIATTSRLLSLHIIPTAVPGRIILKNQCFLTDHLLMQCYNMVKRPGFYSLRQGVATVQAGLELLILLLLKVLSLHTCTTKAGKVAFFLLILVTMTVTGDLAVDRKLDFLSVTTYQNPELPQTTTRCLN